MSVRGRGLGDARENSVSDSLESDLVVVLFGRLPAKIKVGKWLPERGTCF